MELKNSNIKIKVENHIIDIENRFKFGNSFLQIKNKNNEQETKRQKWMICKIFIGKNFNKK